MKTTLKYKIGPNEEHECWDDLVLLIASDVPKIVKFKDRTTAYDVYVTTCFAAEENHEGPLDVDIDGTVYTLTEKEWISVANVMQQWFVDFMTANA